MSQWAVLCINRKDSTLTVGAKYVVLHEDNDYYYVEGKAYKTSEGYWAGGMFKWRFKTLDEAPTGWSRCKCGALTKNSATSLCCDCK